MCHFAGSDWSLSLLLFLSLLHTLHTVIGPSLDILPHSIYSRVYASPIRARAWTGGACSRSKRISAFVVRRYCAVLCCAVLCCVSCVSCAVERSGAEWHESDQGESAQTAGVGAWQHGVVAEGAPIPLSFSPFDVVLLCVAGCGSRESKHNQTPLNAPACLSLCAVLERQQRRRCAEQSPRLGLSIQTDGRLSIYLLSPPLYHTRERQMRCITPPPLSPLLSHLPPPTTHPTPSQPAQHS